jgi:hypothetical protein
MSRPTPSPLASSVPPQGPERSGPRPPSPTRPLPLAWLEALPLLLPALFAGFSLVAISLPPLGLAAGVAAA